MTEESTNKPAESMIEAVARAIAHHAGVDPDRERSGAFQWQAYVGIARAAIAAMREPTDAMVDAGAAERFDSRYESEENHAKHVWDAMIDAILNEGEKGGGG
jgi:hypothetical protein